MTETAFDYRSRMLIVGSELALWYLVRRHHMARVDLCVPLYHSVDSLILFLVNDIPNFIVVHLDRHRASWIV